MKNQQVVVDVYLMTQTAVVYLSLALFGWILFRLVQACLWLPGYLSNQNKEDQASLKMTEEVKSTSAKTEDKKLN